MAKGMLACAVLIFVLVGKQEVVSLTIKKCVGRRLTSWRNTKKALVEIYINKNNTIICDGLVPSAPVVWSIKRTVVRVKNSTVATCNSSSCTVQADPAHIAAERNLTQSQLFYYQHDNSSDIDAEISCESRHAGNLSSTSCTFNLVGEIVLSNCFIKNHIAQRDYIRAECDFSGYHSTEEIYRKCQFIQRNATGETKFDASIVRSKCMLTIQVPNWQPCKFTYSVLFWPGLPEEMIIDDDQCNGSPGQNTAAERNDSLETTSSTNDTGSPGQNITAERNDSLETTSSTNDTEYPAAADLGPEKEEKDHTVAIAVGIAVPAVAGLFACIALYLRRTGDALYVLGFITTGSLGSKKTKRESPDESGSSDGEPPQATEDDDGPRSPPVA